MLALTYPDPSVPADAAILILLVFFIFTAAFANLCKIPFLTRGGGLLTYSKFASGVTFGLNVPAKVGMFLLYAPAAVVGFWWWWNVAGDSRTGLAASLMVTHFVKRCFECLFVHKYSGTMPFASSFFIGFFYVIASLSNCHYANMAVPLSKGEFPYTGFFLFSVGLTGNFYHHWLLANLRQPGETKYFVPQGGFFVYVAAPHYFFELIEWFGVVLVTNHFISLLIFLAMCVYLFERATAQTRWNLTKFGEEYPQHRKHIIPFIFWVSGPCAERVHIRVIFSPLTQKTLYKFSVFYAYMHTVSYEVRIDIFKPHELYSVSARLGAENPYPRVELHTTHICFWRTCDTKPYVFQNQIIYFWVTGKVEPKLLNITIGSVARWYRLHNAAYIQYSLMNLVLSSRMYLRFLIKLNHTV